MAESEDNKTAGLEGRISSGLISSYYLMGQSGSEGSSTQLAPYHIAGMTLDENIIWEIARDHKARRIAKEYEGSLITIMQKQLQGVDGRSSAVLVHDCWASDKAGRRSAYSHMLFFDKKELWNRQLTPLDFFPLISDSGVKYPSEAKAMYEKKAGTFGLNLQNALIEDLKDMDSQQKSIAAIAASYIDSESPPVTLYFDLDDYGKMKPGQRESMLRVLNTALRLADQGTNMMCREYTNTDKTPRRRCVDIYPPQGTQQFPEINVNQKYEESASTQFYVSVMGAAERTILPLPEFLKFAKLIRRLCKDNIENGSAELELYVDVLNRAHAQIAEDVGGFAQLHKTPAELGRMISGSKSVLSKCGLEDLQQLGEHISGLEASREGLEKRLAELQAEYNKRGEELAGARQAVEAHDAVAKEFDKQATENSKIYQECRTKLTELEEEHNKCGTALGRAMQIVNAYHKIAEEFKKSSPEELLVYVRELRFGAENLSGQLIGEREAFKTGVESWNNTLGKLRQEVGRLTESNNSLRHDKDEGLAILKRLSDAARVCGAQTVDELVASYGVVQQRLKRFEAIGAPEKLEEFAQKIAEYRALMPPGTPEEYRTPKRLGELIFALERRANEILDSMEAKVSGAKTSARISEGGVTIRPEQAARSDKEVREMQPGLQSHRV